jgi:hypothetical protein
LNAGIIQIIHGPNAAKMNTPEHDKVKALMNKSGAHRKAMEKMGKGGTETDQDKVKIVKFKGRVGKVMFETTNEYMEKKFGNCIIDTESDVTINHFGS